MKHLSYFQTGQVSQEMIEIAIISAPQDAKYCHMLVIALEGARKFLEKNERVRVWHKEQILSGSLKRKVIEGHIQAARIILLLMSQDLLADRFYNDEINHIETILQRSQLEHVEVIPVLIRACSWKRSPFGALQPLPANEVPLAESKIKEKTLDNIVESVMAHVEKMLAALPVEAPLPLETEATREKPAVSSSPFIHGYALLIGTGGDLAVTVDDAQRLKRVLEHSSRAAYPATQVDILLDQHATRANILAAFDRLIQRVSHDPDATVIVYFSGHGGKFSQHGRPPEYFLIPSGYDPVDQGGTAISDHELTAKIQAIQARKLVVLLDCCHAAGISRLKDAGQRFVMSPLAPELLQALSSGGGRVIVASSHEDEKSQTDALGSIFTNCLLEALRGQGTTHRDHAVRILNILSYLCQEIPSRTNNNQRPFIPSISNMSENFILCYSPVQKKDGPNQRDTPDLSSVPASLSLHQREELALRCDELRASLQLSNEKIAFLNREIDEEAATAEKRFQYQQHLFQEIQQRTRLEEELATIIRQTQP